ncbi:MAG: cation transporter [Phycisphaerales bacterium]|nr:cation transporter [Phycisphaerales bacterium]
MFSLAINTGLAVIKLAGGLLGHSYALVADAIESLGDIFSAAIVRAGLVIAARPPDEDHPYGHGKAEPLAALAVAILLIGGAAVISYHAVFEIMSPHQAPAPFTLGILAAVIVLKEAVYRHLSRVGADVGSTALCADAWHHRGDALTSAAAAVGITVALIGGPGYESADDWAALAACVIILANGTRFARTAIAELMDTRPPDDIANAISEVARRVDGARFVEKVVIRKVGPWLYADLHVEVDPELTVRRGHEIAHRVKDAVVGAFTNVADVLVHIEPHAEDGRPRSSSG